MAGLLEQEGHNVTVMDLNEAAFRRLPQTFRGNRVVGNGMDAFLAVTQGDNRNYFASQMAHEVYGVKRVLCRIYDPIREEIFRDLGLETFSPTRFGAQIMVDMLHKEPAKR
jgi:trk system potassium uptake protein TrkA